MTDAERVAREIGAIGNVYNAMQAYRHALGTGDTGRVTQFYYEAIAAIAAALTAPLKERWEIVRDICLRHNLASVHDLTPRPAANPTGWATKLFDDIVAAIHEALTAPRGGDVDDARLRARLRALYPR